MMNSNSVPVLPNINSRSTESKGLTQSIGFKSALVLVFLRFSNLHEMLSFITGKNNYLPYVFGPAAVLAAISSGRLRYIFRERPPKFWLRFAGWMLIAVPFSSWKGGSFTAVIAYIKTDFIMLLVTAALATKWVDCRQIMYAIAAAAVSNIATAYLFLKPSGDRLALEWSGTIGNSNDLAAHLLLVLPFLLFVALKPGTWALFRFGWAVAIAFGIFEILRTASRGA